MSVPLEFDKIRGERDWMNPQSFQLARFCMNEVRFLQQSHARPPGFTVITAFPLQPFAPGVLAAGGRIRRHPRKGTWILIQWATP